MLLQVHLFRRSNCDLMAAVLPFCRVPDGIVINSKDGAGRTLSTRMQGTHAIRNAELNVLPWMVASRADSAGVYTGHFLSKNTLKSLNIRVPRSQCSNNLHSK